MSGGSYNYVCFAISDAARNIHNKDINPHRKFLSELMILVADAMHDVEWVDSADMGPGDEIASIEKVMSFFSILDKNILLDAERYKIIERVVFNK